MTPDELAALHASCFTDAPPPWSAPEFAGSLQGHGAFLLLRPAAFLLGRVIAGEAELLTLAVVPDARRHGLGRDLTLQFAATSRARGADVAFLEVAEDNHPARALYIGLGWTEVGRRRRYYGPQTDALVMRIRLQDHQEDG